MIELLHQFSVFGMTGVIWIIQRLVYPGFATVGESQWSTHHQTHTQRITPIVFPLMLTQLICSGLIYYQDKSLLNVTHLAFALTLWAMTAFIFVPLHHRLKDERSTSKIGWLVRLNWIRTALWSAGTILLLVTH